MNKFDVDQGMAFGTWSDDTSRFMYSESLNEILPLLNLSPDCTIGDFGGANGLLKVRLPNVTTIDIDPTKRPDIVDDILTHRGMYDVAWCRYVLHYLTDQQVISFCDNVNAPLTVIVQFVNADLCTKYGNSVGETKYFRTQDQLEALLPFWADCIYSKEYPVTPEFYKNRLGLDGAAPHMETLNVYVF